MREIENLGRKVIDAIRERNNRRFVVKSRLDLIEEVLFLGESDHEYFVVDGLTMGSEGFDTFAEALECAEVLNGVTQ